MPECGLGPSGLFLSLISLLSTLLLWPVCLALSAAGVELVSWTQLPWLQLTAAAALTLGETAVASRATPGTGLS